jgi:putative transposase
MVLYRRNRVPGGTYFFTVTLADRGSDVLVRHIGLLREAVRVARRERPFRIDAVVVLPDHLHAVWTLPQDDADYPARWRRIKGHFSRRVAAVDPTIPKNRRGEYRLWQRRYWEHTIRNETDFARHIDYVHYNPVKHGLVERVRDWRYSSFHRYVRARLLPEDWAGEPAGARSGEGSESPRRWLAGYRPP